MLAYVGGASIVLEPVDLNTIIEETYAVLPDSALRPGLLHAELAPDLPSVFADATQLRQVVMNLVINAAEALEEGVGTIRVRTSAVRLTEADLAETRHGSEAAPGPHVCLEVADTGLGIPADKQADLFTEFHQTRASHERVGTGLGLSIVSQFVRLLGGVVSFVSREGEGTRFTVKLPLAFAESRGA